MANESIITLLKYKKWADDITLKSIKAIDHSAFPKQHHLMLRLMNHIYVVDKIFQANINEVSHHYTALNTPDTPTVDDLLQNMAETTDWYIHKMKDLSDSDLLKTIRFTFVDGGMGEMKLADMINHILFHGTYHRGAVGWLIAECGAIPPKDVLTVFLRDHHD